MSNVATTIRLAFVLSSMLVLAGCVLLAKGPTEESEHFKECIRLGMPVPEFEDKCLPLIRPYARVWKVASGGLASSANVAEVCNKGNRCEPRDLASLLHNDTTDPESGVIEPGYFVAREGCLDSYCWDMSIFFNSSKDTVIGWMEVY